MNIVRYLLAALIVLPMAGAPAFAGNKDAVKKEGKTGPEYLQMPRMAVPVRVEGTEASRQLEVEMWIYVANPELMVKLNSRRSVVADTIREKLKKNTAETYMSADEGPLAIKEIARDAVEREIGKDAGEDILIKSLIVR
jgi:flagellar basal body-associated protein FliL